MDALIVSELVIEQAVADIHGPNGTSARLQETVCETARGGADIQTDLSANGNSEVIEGTAELLTAAGNKTPGLVVPAAIAIATANPVGLIVVGGAKLYGATSGRSGLEGRAKSTADEIAAQLKIRFQDRGWIA